MRNGSEAFMNNQKLETLLHENELYHYLIDEVNVGIHVINHEGKTILYNKKMEAIESMKREDILGRDVLDMFSFHENQHSTLLHTLRTGKETRNVKQTYFNHKGEAITTINDTFPIQQDGKRTEAVEMAKDITQLEHVITENILKKKDTSYSFHHIIGENQAFSDMIHQAKLATRTTSSVLIIGETGTGKELFAQSIHNGSIRAAKPFIAQNCAAIPESLMESLLFGTKKGAFTDATDSPGLFEQADGGTLLLDEINSLNPLLQTKLLRVLQEKTIRRIGDTKDKPVDVRIIATMNEDPETLLEEQQVRSDLYYRLSVVSLVIPPLRERKEDMLSLIQLFIEKYNQLFQMHIQNVDDTVLEMLYQHDWPGNVRELEHVIEGAMNIAVEETTILPQHLPSHFRKKHQPSALKKGSNAKEATTNSPATETLESKKALLEKTYIQQVLQENNQNITQSAKILGLSRQSLQYRIKKYQLF